MTDIESLQHSLLSGEGQRIEFKESFGKGVIESLVAFANADGGQVVVGANPSMPRNKQIASIFREAGLIEKYGSGIRRVLQVMHKVEGRVPIFECSGGFFKVTLFPMGTMGERVNKDANTIPHDTPHVTPMLKSCLAFAPHHQIGNNCK